MPLVRNALVDALAALRVEGAAGVATRNRWRCNADGVADAAAAYSVWCQTSFDRDPPPHIRAADSLASICLQAIERGRVIDRDRRHIPLLLASIVGFVPDHAREAAKEKRTGRDPYLLGPIGDALKDTPDATWKEIATWLEGESVVVNWDENHVEYFDADEHKRSITARAFQNLITKAKNKIRG